MRGTAWFWQKRETIAAVPILAGLCCVASNGSGSGRRGQEWTESYQKIIIFYNENNWTTLYMILIER